jgi:hypothetical protein
MTTSLRLFLAVAGASALSGAALAYAPPDPTLEIVIGNGPYAGTYTVEPSDVMCMRFKQGKNVTAVFKDFDAKDPRKVAEAAINIWNPDEAAPKWGSVQVAFGPRSDKSATRYEVKITADNAGPITIIKHGKGADLAFQGRTKDGISLRVTAKCLELEEL